MAFDYQDIERARARRAGAGWDSGVCAPQLKVGDPGINAIGNRVAEVDPRVGHQSEPTNGWGERRPPAKPYGADGNPYGENQHPWPEDLLPPAQGVIGE
ncbi:hypothetical protein QTH97_02295 [Variovorax sp. J22R24]|uniref:hypothetical protein n=1 Tax=Variovorax gracilis TaxID=3053502 RepID=UPI0025762538|nr:hypothetical protein [Variovorax sp. J22R24]MDM0103747.1 hypothetical protein [Variovorax sp. J22R24]